jgi:hypothetical protein
MEESLGVFYELSDEGQKGLAVLGKLCVSRNRTSDRHTFRRKMTSRLRGSNRSSDDILDELANAQLVEFRTSDRLALSPKGLQLAHYARNKELKEQHPHMRILKRG